MSDVKISQLPEFTGNTSGSYLVMNDASQTTTYKVIKENYIFPYNGNATITGSLKATGAITAQNALNAGYTGITVGGNLNLYSATNTLSITAVKQSPKQDITFENGYFSGSGYYFPSNSIFLSIPSGSNTGMPSPQMPRGLAISGSLQLTGSILNQVYNVPIVNSTASLDLNKGNVQFLDIPSSLTGYTVVTITATSIVPGWLGTIRIQGGGNSTSGLITGSTGYIFDTTKFVGNVTSSINMLSGSSLIGQGSTYGTSSIFLPILTNIPNTVGK